MITEKKTAEKYVYIQNVLPFARNLKMISPSCIAYIIFLTNKFQKRKQVVTGHDLERVHQWGDSPILVFLLLCIILTFII